VVQIKRQNAKGKLCYSIDLNQAPILVETALTRRGGSTKGKSVPGKLGGPKKRTEVQTI
jgi:hypothetical protein